MKPKIARNKPRLCEIIHRRFKATLGLKDKAHGGLSDALEMCLMNVIPHAAVYLGCLTNTGIPEEDGAGLCSYDGQNVTIFIPIHSHTAPSESRMEKSGKETRKTLKKKK